MTTEQKLKALKRELSFRYAVYPKKVKSGTMSQDEADHEIKVISEIIKDYEKLLPPKVEQPSLF